MEPRHKVVSRDEWLAARKALLANEKALTRARDALSEERRRLPWVRVEKEYVFDGPDGRETLADLFAGRSQLIVKHFMLGPDWEEGCVGCSFQSDHIDGVLPHLEHHDVTLLAVSRAPFDKIDAFKKRMGWRFKWVSSFASDFNYDYNVSFTPGQIASGEMYYNFEKCRIDSDELSGISVFHKDSDGDIFHTYSQYARGGEMMIGTYSWLDITPKGREENVRGNLTDWVRHHDRYGADDMS
ncbi:MAG TPA: thioredoxin family protein [Acetobacteraceae bacterium]